MRKFAIYNNSGKCYKLNHHPAFFHDPEGLGFERDSDYTKIGTRYEIAEDSFKQHTISGSISFRDTTGSFAYQKYNDFIRFCEDKPLTLHYFSDSDHSIDVVLSKVKKTELERLYGLDVDVEFTALSLFYDETEKSGTTSVEILSEAEIDSPCHIQISGYILNPIWVHKVDGVQVASGALTAEIPEGSTLHVRTDTNPYRIYMTDALGTETDLYSSSDWSTDRFIHLKKGVNTITCESATALKVEGRLEYVSV